MKDTEQPRSLIIPIAIVISILGAALTVMTGWNYYQTQSLKEAKGYSRAIQQADDVANSINAEMQAEMALTREMAEKLSSGGLPYDQIIDYMRNMVSQNSNLLGMFVGFAPYAYQPDVELYAPYLMKDANGNVNLKMIEYDYTDPSRQTAQWYSKAMESGSNVWSDPYFGEASQDLLLTYSVPFKAPGEETELAGVVVISQSVTNTFKNFIQNADLGYGGHLFLVNSENKITFHPDLELISENVSQISKRIDGFSLEDALASANSSGKKYKGTISFQDPEISQTVNKDTSWFFVRPLLNPAGWKVVVVISTLDTTYDPETNVRQLTNIYLALLVFLIGLAMLVLRVDKMITTRLMVFSVTVGWIFLIGILWIWYVVYTNPQLNHQKVLVNRVGVDRNLAEMYQAFDGVRAEYPEQIPTGVLIENLTMTNQSVKFSGYLWQKYPLDFPEENIKFPQFTDQISSLANEEVYHYTKDDQQVIGWFFSTEVQQRFDNHLYPLDQAIIKIQIEPSVMSSKYVLVPAYLDYDYMSPAFKPGLAGNLKVRGWDIKNSFFTYDVSSYGTNFGLFRQIPKDDIPNLIFNIRMTRDILSPIIAYCIVIYIVVMQIYGVSVLKIENPYQVLSIAAALFLVVAITHNGMRDAIAITGVVYLEYYFILLYLTILATSVNAIMWATKIQIPIVTYRDNLAIKVLFWPVFLGIGLCFTLITFYPFDFLRILGF